MVYFGHYCILKYMCKYYSQSCHTFLWGWKKSWCRVWFAHPCVILLCIYYDCITVITL